MPYPNEHACRLRDPDDFRDESFIRETEQTEDGKPFDVIYGELVEDGATEAQSQRYPVDTWSEDEARDHCQESDGILFEPAANEDEEEEGGAKSSLRLDTGEAGAPRFLQSMTDQVWAVQSPAVLRELAHIAQRHGSTEAVERRRGQRMDDTRGITIRDGVAILPVMGPIFPRANLFTEVSGATSIQTMALDLQRTLDRPDIKAVLLNVDSPGGAVTGVDEMAGMIAEVAKKKPVTAYVSGTAASAAYWLASAAREIVVTRTGQVGSIGVVATVPQQQEPDEQGVMDFEIVSSNAPDKRPDPATDDGRRAVLDRINPIETLFIDTVAANRGISRETVLSDFGQGNVVVGQQAVDRDMADRTGTYEGVLAELQRTRAPGGPRAVAEAEAGEGEPSSDSAAASAAPLRSSDQEEGEMPDGTKPAEAESAGKIEKEAGAKVAEPADVVEMCNQAGVPDLAAGLIREKATTEQVRDRIQSVGTMRERCDAAVSAGMVGKEKADELLDTALKAGKGPDGLSSDLLTHAVQEQSGPVQSQITPDTQAGAGHDGWDHAFAQVQA